MTDLKSNKTLNGIKVQKNSLEAFKKMYSPKKMILVGEKGIPVHEFLQLNPNDLF